MTVGWVLPTLTNFNLELRLAYMGKTSKIIKTIYEQSNLLVPTNLRTAIFRRDL